MIFTAPFTFVCCPLCLDTFNPLFSTFFFILHSLDYIPTNTSILSAAPLVALGTGTNTLEGLQTLAQLQFSCGLK